MIHKISRYLLTLVALLAMTTGAWAQTVTVTWTLTDLQANPDVTTFTKDGVTIKCDTRLSSGKSFNGPVTISTTLGNFTKIEITGSNVAPTTADGFTNDGNVSTWTGNAASISTPASIAYATQFVFTIAPAGPTVTLNEAKTEATMEMPAYDATLSYELVRDMAVDVDATIADRIRIKKENNAYVAVTATELIPAVSDKISGTAVAMTVTTDYTVKLQKKVEGDTPSWTDATALSVGTFRYVITGAGLYDGEITTTEFQLFEGYEVTIPAGEYATYYRTDDNLKIDGENTGGKLYTITGVSGSTATATEITSANKEMPFLIYNGNTEAKTFLLIPTDTEIDQTFYAGFVGTAEDTNIAASSAEQNNYAFNGKQFVWVKTEIAVGANKCWLAIPTGVTSNAREINLVFGNTSGIDTLNAKSVLNGDWYDLNGRKLQNMPTKKGVYILNGRKVVVK